MMYRTFGKRLLDIAISGGALLLFSPVLLSVAMAIWLEDRGPSLFRQERVGQNRQTFIVLKFRSMAVNTGDIPSAKADAVQITQVGKFIRRTNIDELPQLLNILWGDMSIVGPRPALAKQIELCKMRDIKGALRCKPGLTGLAQINSYGGMPDVEKADWDAQYCASVSFRADIIIIIKTFRYLLKPPPVY